MDKHDINIIRNLLPSITRGTTHYSVDARKEPGKELSSEELDAYMVEHNLCGLKTAWIELSKYSAYQHLFGIIDGEREDWFDEKTSVWVSLQITRLFFSFFDTSARFFCNGLVTSLDEHPLIEPKRIVTKVTRPFSANCVAEVLYRSWANFTTDRAEDCFGIVACDRNTIGMLLIKPSWIDMG